MGHLDAAQEHLHAAAADADTPWVHVGIAGVHAMLHLAETVQHGLRDIIYELRS